MSQMATNDHATATSTTTPFAPTDENLAKDKLNLTASLPFILLHLACGLALVTGVTWQWVALALVSYYVRMFAVTAGYHRYFAHRAFKTGRVFQFVLAVVAQSSIQKGVLWWAAHHRHHHRYSDQPEDIHSPARRGFWYSHMLWILGDRYSETNTAAIKDFARFPELVWLNTFHLVPALSLAAGLFACGGLPWLVWGFIIPTVALWHGTFTINSLTHIFGKRRYLTTDMSRNSFLLAIITCGEGWHNNHHFHQNTANQGWFWWEVDFTFYALKVLSWVGVVSNLRLPAQQTKLAHLKYTEAQRAQLRAESRYGMYLPQPPPAPTPAPVGSTLMGLMAPPPAPIIRR
jgi:stearoyl-CoA desaturase (delta-9 desaturase)